MSLRTVMIALTILVAWAFATLIWLLVRIEYIGDTFWYRSNVAGLSIICVSGFILILHGVWRGYNTERPSLVSKRHTRIYDAIQPPVGRGEYVYLIQDTDISGYIKIGHTNNLVRRLNEIGATKGSVQVRLIHFIRCTNRIHTERSLHKLFKKKRIRGEWFDLNNRDIRDLMGVKEWISDG